jgi:hypothetical protein
MASRPLISIVKCDDIRTADHVALCICVREWIGPKSIPHGVAKQNITDTLKQRC